MKIFLLVAAVLFSSQAMAGGRPDTYAMLKQARMAYIKKMEDLATNAATYRIELCDEGSCDRFEAHESKLQELSDYVYLFAVFSGQYDKYYPDVADVVTKHELRDDPMVSDAKNKGYAQAVMDAYRSQYGCPQGPDERKCIMHGLFKAADVKRFSVGYDEGETYGEVDEDYGSEKK